MPSPFFSVIMPTYNRADIIASAIKSVIGQTFRDWELIVVDDGSTDNTKSIIQSFNDKRIIYIYQENSEKCVARNNGIHHASGLYITFLDNDDYYLPIHLEVFFNRIQQLQQPVAMLISGLYIEEGNSRYSHPLYDSGKTTALRFVWNTFIVPGAVCLHKNILKKYRFSEKFYLWEDRHLWLRILTEFPLIQIPVYTVVLVEHTERLTRRFYSRISAHDVKIYFNSIEDLFQSHGTKLIREISPADKRNFIAAKAWTLAQISVKNAQLRETIYLMQKLITNKPTVLLKPLYYKLLLLLPVKMLKGNLRRLTH